MLFTASAYANESTKFSCRYELYDYSNNTKVAGGPLESSNINPLADYQVINKEQELLIMVNRKEDVLTLAIVEPNATTNIQGALMPMKGKGGIFMYDKMANNLRLSVSCVKIPLQP